MSLRDRVMIRSKLESSSHSGSAADGEMMSMPISLITISTNGSRSPARTPADFDVDASASQMPKNRRRHRRPDYIH